MSRTIVDLCPLRLQPLLEHRLEIVRCSTRRLQCKSAQRLLHRHTPILTYRVPLVVRTSSSRSDVCSILWVTLSKPPYNIGHSSHYYCTDNKCYDHESIEQRPNLNSCT